MNFVFKQILNCRHMGGLDCTFLDMKLISEHRKGFFCSWLFKCLVWQIKIKIDSENNSQTEYVGVNKAAVSGSIAIGIGHTQLNEFSASIDVPCISPNVFIKLQSNIGEIINETAWDEIYLAGMIITIIYYVYSSVLKNCYTCVKLSTYCSLYVQSNPFNVSHYNYI